MGVADEQWAWRANDGRGARTMGVARERWAWRTNDGRWVRAGGSVLTSHSSQKLAGGTLTQINDGADEVDGGGEHEDRKPAAVRLRHEFSGEWAARDARDRGL